MMPKVSRQTSPARSPARRRRARGTTRRSGRRFSVAAGAAPKRRSGRVIRNGPDRRTAGADASRVVVVATRSLLADGELLGGAQAGRLGPGVGDQLGRRRLP